MISDDLTCKLVVLYKINEELNCSTFPTSFPLGKGAYIATEKEFCHQLTVRTSSTHPCAEILGEYAVVPVQLTTARTVAEITAHSEHDILEDYSEHHHHLVKCLYLHIQASNPEFLRKKQQILALPHSSRGSLFRKQAQPTQRTK